MRDPFAETAVDARRSVIVTAVVLAGAAAFALARPSAFWTMMLIFGFLLMIVLHEAGHFVTAKLTGMQATEFFVGFGPRLWSRRRGETEYGLKALPLGGYVKITGMTNLDDVPPEDEPRAYRSKSYPSKLLVASAGSLVHFMIAILLMFTVLAIAGNVRESYLVPTVGDLSETDNGPAAAAGLQDGDVVTTIDGVPVESWDELTAVVRERPGETVDFVIERGDAVRTVAVDLAAENPRGDAVGYAGIQLSPDTELVTPEISVVGAAVRAPAEVYELGRESISALGRIFSFSGLRNYAETVGGGNEGEPEANDRFISPVGFGQVANEAVRAGWIPAVGLLIVINVFVGLFNLVPLLPFDGGHVAIASYEAAASRLRGRRVVVDVNKLMPLTIGVVSILGFIFLSSLFLDVTQPVEAGF